MEKKNLQKWEIDKVGIEIGKVGIDQVGIKLVHNVIIQLQKTPSMDLSSWSYTPVWPWTALIFGHFDMFIAMILTA